MILHRCGRIPLGVYYDRFCALIETAPIVGPVVILLRVEAPLAKVEILKEGGHALGAS